MTLRSGKELEEAIKTSDDPSKAEELIFHDVQVEEATPKVATKDVSKSMAKGVKSLIQLQASIHLISHILKG